MRSGNYVMRSKAQENPFSHGERVSWLPFLVKQYIAGKTGLTWLFGSLATERDREGGSTCKSYVASFDKIHALETTTLSNRFN